VGVDSEMQLDERGVGRGGELAGAERPVLRAADGGASPYVGRGGHELPIGVEHVTVERHRSVEILAPEVAHVEVARVGLHGNALVPAGPGEGGTGRDEELRAVLAEAPGRVDGGLAQLRPTGALGRDRPAGGQIPLLEARVGDQVGA